MDPSDADRLVAVLGILAAVAAALASALVIRLHQLRTGVDVRTDGVSAYALGRFGALYRAQVRVSGLAAACIAGASLVAGVGHIVGVTALVAYAGSRIAIARYPTDPPGTSKMTPTGRMHALLATISFLGLAVAAPALGMAAEWGRLPGGLTTLLAALSVAVPIAGGATFVAGAAARGVFGLVERMAYAAGLSWLMVTAAALTILGAT